MKATQENIAEVTAEQLSSIPLEDYVTWAASKYGIPAADVQVLMKNPKWKDETQRAYVVERGAQPTHESESRQRLQGLLENLQQQAATGGGAWEQAFKQATNKSLSTAQALGQSAPGVGYQSALRNAANAQGAVAQRAVGGEEQLRAKQKQSATDLIAGLTSGVADQDVEKSIAEAKSRQAARSAEIEQQAQQQQNAINLVGGAGSGLAGLAGASDGGRVPGAPQVFGDDERNDTVPAMLSPGEIVIPRTKASSPEEAAEFVRAINGKGGPGYADGGEVGDGGGSDYLGGFFSALAAPFKGPQQEAASVEGGGRLQTEEIEGSRNAQIANQELLKAQAAGTGPSAARAQAQSATDAAIAAAMQAQAAQRAPAGDIANLGAGAAQNAAEAQGSTVGGETRASQATLINSMLGQRNRDLAQAQAQREAYWRNELMNAGVGMQQQQMMQNILGGAGQAVSTFASMSAGGEVGVDQQMGEDERRRAAAFVASLRGAA